MKQYLVLMTDLAVAPLQGQNPRKGRTQDFDEIDAASAFAASEKDKWNLVFVFRRQEGNLEELERYEKGRKY